MASFENSDALMGGRQDKEASRVAFFLLYHD